jgi:magnesium chelatase subunit H
VELPTVDAAQLTLEERDTVVGKLYAKLMEIESRQQTTTKH